MCTGRPPFRGDSAVTVLRQVCDATPRPIREANANVPPWLADLVNRLLAKRPADRFDSAAEVAALLGRGLAEMQNPPPPASAPTIAVAPTASPQGIGHPRRGRRWAVAAAALAAVLMVGGTTEATGVTEVIPTVVRLVRGNGTLVVRTNDPDVGVSIEGEDLVLTGTGLSEVRLKPGTYTVQATKNGRPAFRELVTVERNGRETVNIRWEPGPAAGVPAAAEPTEVDPPAPAVAAVNQTPAAPPAPRFIAPRVGLRASHATDGQLVPVRRFVGHTAPAKSVAVSPDGTLVASGSGWPEGDRTARVWKVATGESVHVFHHPAAVRSVAFAPDGARLLTAAADGVVRAFDLSTGEEAARYEGPNELTDATTTPDGSRVAAASVWGEAVFIWDAQTGAVIYALKHERAQPVRVAITPDGGRVVAADRSGRLLIWNLSDGTFERALPVKATDRQGGVGLALTADGQRALTGDNAGLVRLWDLESGEMVWSVTSGVQAIQSIALSPDGTTALIAGGAGPVVNRALALLDVATGEKRLDRSYEGGFLWDAAFLPGDRGDGNGDGGGGGGNDGGGGDGEQAGGGRFVTVSGSRWKGGAAAPTGDDAVGLWNLTPEPAANAGDAR